MKDPIDIADEIFVITLQVSQRLDQSEEFRHLESTFRALADQLSEEVSMTHPLSMMWAGATIQAIKDELIEAADECNDSSDVELTEYLDTAACNIDKLFLSEYDEENSETNEDYGLGNQDNQ